MVAVQTHRPKTKTKMADPNEGSSVNNNYFIFIESKKADFIYEGLMKPALVPTVQVQQ
jgi:hypothetical protein